MPCQIARLAQKGAGCAAPNASTAGFKNRPKQHPLLRPARLRRHPHLLRPQHASPNHLRRLPAHRLMMASRSLRFLIGKAKNRLQGALKKQALRLLAILLRARCAPDWEQAMHRRPPRRLRLRSQRLPGPIRSAVKPLTKPPPLPPSMTTPAPMTKMTAQMTKVIRNSTIARPSPVGATPCACGPWQRWSLR